MSKVQELPISLISNATMLKLIAFIVLVILGHVQGKLFGWGAPELIAAGANFVETSRLLGNEMVNTASTCDGWTVITTRACLSLRPFSDAEHIFRLRLLSCLGRQNVALLVCQTPAFVY